MSNVIELEAYRIKKQAEQLSPSIVAKKDCVDAQKALNKMFEDMLDSFPAPKKD